MDDEKTLTDEQVTAMGEWPEFKLGKTYYIDGDSKFISDAEVMKLRKEDCRVTAETCLRLVIPPGYILDKKRLPSGCVDFSRLFCLKTPFIKKVTLPNCNPLKPPRECEVVAGYEVRAVGPVTFTFNLPVRPINGVCTFGTPTSACGSKEVQVNGVIDYSCSPVPCPCPATPCVRFSLFGWTVNLETDHCGEYYRVNMFVILRSAQNCP